MAMDQGSVNDAGAGTGAAKVLFDALWAKQVIDPLAKADAVANARKQVADMANSVAEIIGYIQDNSEVNAVVGPADLGLQTYTPVGAPAPIPTTANPALPVTGTPLAISVRVK